MTNFKLHSPSAEIFAAPTPNPNCSTTVIIPAESGKNDGGHEEPIFQLFFNLFVVAGLSFECLDERLS